MGRFREEKIIKTQEEANQTSSLYVLPVDESTFRLIITDDLGEKKISTVLTGNTEFIQLSDAPLSYVNNAGKVVVVNFEEDGLIFTDIPPGEKGEAATIDVGTVTTVESNQPAVITNTGTANDAVFDFEIPKGEKGEPGEPTILTFEIDENMHLIMQLETSNNLTFELDSNGHLIVNN